MNEQEKIDLTKQKKLVDCIEHLNMALDSFSRLEDCKAKILPIIDGFDLNHSDTYFELTKQIGRELTLIRFSSFQAAEQLVEYRRLCHPGEEIYSVKQKKHSLKLKPLDDWKKRDKKKQRVLQQNTKQLDKMLTNSSSPEKLKSRLDRANEIKEEKQQHQTKRIEKIELSVLRLQWTMFLLFAVQVMILIKLWAF